MAEEKVLANNTLLFLDTTGGTDYDLVVCLEDNSYNVAVNEIDATSKCGVDTKVGTIDTTLSLSGQVLASPGSGKISDFAIEQALRQATSVGWKFGKATPVAGDVTRSGAGILTSLEITAAQNEVVKFSAELKATGTVTVVEES